MNGIICTFKHSVVEKTVTGKEKGLSFNILCHLNQQFSNTGLQTMPGKSEDSPVQCKNQKNTDKAVNF